MKDGSDPFETLRRINPVDPSTLPDPERSREALDAMERIIRGDAAAAEGERFRRTRSLWRTRRRRVYLVPIVAAAALAAATLAWALTRGPTQHLDIGCYATIDLHGRAAVVPATEASPIETCEKLWLTGVFGKPPPPLEACVLPSGAVGVFPSPEENSCERLNLAPAPAGSEPPPSSVELQNTLVDHAAGNYRLLMTMSAELLAFGMAQELQQLDEKFYLEVFQPKLPRSAANKKAKV